MSPVSIVVPSCSVIRLQRVANCMTDGRGAVGGAWPPAASGRIVVDAVHGKATRDAAPRSPAVAPDVVSDHRVTGIPREDASQLLLGRRAPVGPLPILRGIPEKGVAGLLVDLDGAAIKSGVGGHGVILVV